MSTQVSYSDSAQQELSFAAKFMSIGPSPGGGGLTQKCRTCMGVGGCFRDPKHKSNMYTFVQQRGVSIFYPESQKYKWYFCTHIS